MSQKICKCCLNPIVPLNPRIKNQQYCGNESCQRARKAAWQRKKMAIDQDYKEDQYDRQKNWRKANPDYYREYRRRNTEYTKRNREQQRERDKRKREGCLAKMDAKNARSNNSLRVYQLCLNLAKMDAAEPKAPLSISEIKDITPIGHLAKMDASSSAILIFSVT